jgi:hypothetical protein
MATIPDQEAINGTVQSVKKPGHLVLGTDLHLYIVAEDGRQVRHERPRRRAHRLAAERLRAI